MRLNFCVFALCCFLFHGCVLSSVILTKKELDADQKMKQAYAHEVANELQEAEEAYRNVAENFSDTIFYEDALFKSAMLNLHPDNPEPNFDAALGQLQAYLKLDLEYEERLLAEVYVSILTLMKQTENEKQKLSAQIIRQKKEAQTEQGKLITELANYELKIKDLEEKLQKLKDIDVQMHEKRRKQRKDM